MNSYTELITINLCGKILIELIYSNLHTLRYRKYSNLRASSALDYVQ